MKKLALLGLVAGTLFAGDLKIVNLPQNSTILLDGKKFFNNDKKFIDIHYKNGNYNILIKNNEFKDIKLDDIDISDKKNIVTLNEDTKDGVKYPVIKAKKFYKNITVSYYKFHGLGDIDHIVDHCVHTTCNVTTSHGWLFGKSNAAYNTYTSGLYVFKNNTNDDKVNVEAKSKWFYSTSTSSNLEKNENVNLYPISSWAFSELGIGFAWNTDDVVLTADDGSGDTLPAETMGGFVIDYSYVHSTMFDIYLAGKFNFYYLFGDTDPNNSENYDDMVGYQYGLGVGHVFSSLLGALRLEAGVMKNSFSYSGARDGWDSNGDYVTRHYSAEDTETQNYIELGIYGFTIFYSKSITSITINGSF